jgi:hypothetical protein
MWEFRAKGRWRSSERRRNDDAESGDCRHIDSGGGGELKRVGRKDEDRVVGGLEEMDGLAR